MLIVSQKHSQEDLDLWRNLEHADKIYYQSHAMPDMETRAIIEVASFHKQAQGRCYCSVSWGKDSVVLAHLVLRANLDIPLVWIKVNPIFNQDCLKVRDLFLEKFHPRYHEIEIQFSGKDDNPTDTILPGLRIAEQEHGKHYISGIRKQESGRRALRILAHGLSTRRSCAPLGYWTTNMVFAYLVQHRLPVHPVYAMLGGGRWTRDKLRVASIGCTPGSAFGRREWEMEYYPEQIRKRM